MWPAFLSRLLRRRILYLLLTLLTFIYLLLKILNKNGALQYEETVIQRTKPLIWRTLQQDVESVETEELLLQNRSLEIDFQCRNSLQGLDLLVDDRGYVCQRTALLSNGCCDTNIESNIYDCQSCHNTTNCCRVYEYCVSCCLHPQKKSLLESVLTQIRGRQAIVFAAVPDQFELCLVKCRTNSHSVAHENRYKDVEYKYCYGHTTAHESELEVLDGNLPGD